MVVFTCGYCGDSVQKPKVEKHYIKTKCRNRSPNLSCMDCFKDFLGGAYKQHTKCVTEEQRYAAKGFVPKEKKGDKKQNSWIELVQSVLEEQQNAPRNVLRIIEAISKQNNTPRKKPKFYNFVKNICGAKTGAKDIERAWDLISPKLAALSTANQRNEKHDSDKKKKETQEGGRNDADSQEKSQDEASQDSHVTENGGRDKGATAEEKTLSKKQRKEEKKRQKYEAELHSAEAPLEEEKEEEVDRKKGKKKKNRTESQSDKTEALEIKKNKRKRQDTVTSVSSNQEGAEGSELGQNRTAKTLKKKPKVVEDTEDTMTLHEQNVAKIRDLAVTDKFNWHAVILSVLQKKGELPFKRLQKKVLAEYSVTTGRDIDDRIADKFIKKLRSAPKVRVEKNRVTLLD